MKQSILSKLFLIFLFVLGFHNCTYSQSSNLIDDYSKFTTFQKQVVLDTATFSSQPFVKVIDDEVYISHLSSYVQSDDKSTNFSYLINVTNDVTYKLTMNEDWLKYELEDLLVTKENIFILIYGKLLVYSLPSVEKRKDTVILKLDESLKLPKNLYRLEKVNDTLIMLLSTSIHGDMKKKEFFYYYLYDITTKEFSNIYKLRFPKGYLYANFNPRKFHSLMNEKLYFSDITQYNVFEVDIKTGQYLDSFSRSDVSNVLSVEKSLAFDNEVNTFRNMNNFVKVGERYYDTIFTVRDLSIVNDSTITLIYQIPRSIEDSSSNQKRILYFDIWRKGKNGFSCISKNNRMSSKIYSNNLLTEYSYDVDYSFQLDRNTFINSTEIPLSISKYLVEKISLKEFKEKQEKYYVENPLAFSIFIYKLKDELFTK